MKKALIFFISLLLLTTNVVAKKQSYKQPIHLDDSGKPMVNSWQKNEEQRQLKKQVVTLDSKTGCKVLDNGQLDPDCKTQNVPVKTAVTPTPVVSTEQGGVTVTSSKSDVQVVTATTTVVEGSAGSTPTSMLVNRPVKVDPKSTEINP